MKFSQSPHDPCISCAEEGEVCLIGVYVDDFVIACKSLHRIQEVKESLACKFDVKDLEKLNYILGVQVKQDEDQVWTEKPTFTESILKKYNMQDAKPVKTPVNVILKLLKATEECDLVDQTLYQSVVRRLLYLSTRTRPDITFAVNIVSCFCSKPTKQHWLAVKHSLRYLRGSTHVGLLYVKGKTDDLVGYYDSD